jgi:hypothetical protein
MVSVLIWSLAFLNVWTAVPPLEATTSPVRIVTMGVDLPSGGQATFNVRSGDRAAARRANGPKFELTPTLLEDGRLESGIVDITVDPASGSESTPKLVRRFLEPDERVRFEFDGLWIAVTSLDLQVRQATT